MTTTSDEDAAQVILDASKQYERYLEYAELGSFASVTTEPEFYAPAPTPLTLVITDR